MKTKIIIPVILGILMLLSVVTFAHAADDITNGQCGDNAYWSFEEETGTLTITGEGSIYGKSMVSDSWHGIEPETIKHVIIGEGVTEINEISFVECVNIETVQLPQTLEKIGTFAFVSYKLKEITIPASVKMMDAHAFFSCSALEKIVIEGDTDMFNSFYGCPSLKEIEFKNVTKISDGAFFLCTSLENVVIPDTVKEIGSLSFALCTNLKSVNLGPVEKIDKYAFYCDMNLENIVIPESVKSIGKKAFFGVKEGNITICTQSAEFGANSVGYSAKSMGKEYLDIFSQLLEINDEFVLRLGNGEIGNDGVDDELSERMLLLEEKIKAYDTSLFLCEEENRDEIEELLADYIGDVAFIPEKNTYSKTNIIDNSTAHDYAKENEITHSIIGSMCDDACGVHDIYENEYIKPTCTENGYIGGKVCIDCEKVFETPEIIKPLGHKVVTLPGVQPTCTEIGFSDSVVCEACGEALSDVRLIQATGHTDADKNGICDSCGEIYDDIEPEPIPDSLGSRVINFLKGIVDAIIALFRKLFG